MPRKLKLSPLQRDILMMLEEAGSEMMGTVIATIAQPDDPREFNRQVDEMVKLGFGSERTVCGHRGACPH